ncbi:MAG: hypothetical protein QF886_02450 [Planctomycetota bacterium]|nr:hypothetical protein [Planctomycetota bacterium]
MPRALDRHHSNTGITSIQYRASLPHRRFSQAGITSIQYRVSSIPAAPPLQPSRHYKHPVSSIQHPAARFSQAGPTSIQYPCRIQNHSNTGITSIKYRASSIPAASVASAKPALPASSIEYPVSALIIRMIYGHI